MGAEGGSRVGHQLRCLVLFAASLTASTGDALAVAPNDLPVGNGVLPKGNALLCKKYRTPALLE